MNKRLLLSAAMPAAILMIYDPAAAQDTPPEQPINEERSSGAAQVAEIVVTATRREANLQEVPATIQALTSENLKAMNIDGILKLPTLVPGLVIVPTGGNNIFLRGIGSASTGYNEAQTATYIDGVYLANPAMGLFSFNSVERIEVLKGPQGTLYGRNATAGLVSVVTRDPSPEFALDASMGIANYRTVSGSLYVSVPVAPALAANVSLFYQDQQDGWATNVFTGNDGMKAKEFGLLTKVRWQPGDDTTVTASFIYDYNNRTYGYAAHSYSGTLSLDGTPYLGEYLFASRIDPTLPFRSYVGSLKVVQELGGVKLTSISAFQSSELTAYFPSFSPSPGTLASPTAYQYVPQTSRTWSQEVQLNGGGNGSRLDWVLGAFYYNDVTTIDIISRPTCIAGVCVGVGGRAPSRVFGRPTTEAVSGFADLTYSLFDRTRLTVGLRYNDERKALTGFSEPVLGFSNSVPGPRVPFTPSAAVPGEKSWSKLSYRFVVAQDIGDDIHLFASHNLGFKAGAYNANSFTNSPVDPELLYATEVGIKSELFDRRLRFNISYFHYNYQDVQLRSLTPPALPGRPLLLNVARENIDGVDVDFSAVLTDNLTLNGAFEILDARYADYPGATCVNGPNRSPGGAVLPGASVFTCNFAGKRLAFAPPFSASLGIVYQVETDAGSFTLNANDQYQSAHPLSGDGFMRQRSFHLIDASITWRSRDGHFNAQLWGRNLTDQFLWASAAQTNEFAAMPMAPRTFGIKFGYSY